MNGLSLLLHTARHLFAKTVSYRSAKFTTGTFTLKKLVQFLVWSTKKVPGRCPVRPGMTTSLPLYYWFSTDFKFTCLVLKSHQLQKAVYIRL